MTLADYFGVFLLGLLGSGHCIGMCGPFAVAVGAGARNVPSLIARQIAYQLGKATSYMFIGLVLLTVGGWIDGRLPMLRMQHLVAWVTGLVMILCGATYALEWRLPPVLARWWEGGALCGTMSVLWHSPSLLKSLLIGWINGFLPCGLSLTAVLYLVNYGKLEVVAVGAYVFGFGTMPGLLLLALVGQKISLRSRRWLTRAAGMALIVFGVLTVVRGNPSVHGWLHEHLVMDGGGDGHSHSH